MQYPNQPNPPQPNSYNQYSPTNPYPPAQVSQPQYGEVPPPPTYGDPTNTYYAPYGFEQPKKSNDKGMLFIGVGLALAVIIVAIAVIFVVLNPSQPSGGVEGAWKQYRQPTGKFLVDFPGTPKEEKMNQSSPVGNLEFYVYQLSTNSGNMLYQVGYNDFPMDLINNAPDKNTLLDGAVSGGVGAMGGKKLSEKPLQIGGNPGRELKVSVSSPVKGEFTIRIFLVKNRLYQVMAGGTVGKIDQKGLDRFINSFRLL
jgi:hypothetical protein